MNIGILGGGQLGKMLVEAAVPQHECLVFTPIADCPAATVANTVIADYSDKKALEKFTQQVDVIGLEFENIPVESLEYLTTLKPVFPNANVLRISQDRLLEKQFIKQQGVATAPFLPVASAAALSHGIGLMGQGILKTRRFGYDGKGQIKVSHTDNTEKIWQELNGQPAILEGIVNFEAEISVIVARDQQGETMAWPPALNHHEGGILRRSLVPCQQQEPVVKEATDIAKKLAIALDIIGLLAVEFFVEANGTIRVNEIAPRPHNSGHWTMNGSKTSQFMQYINCLTDTPLGNTDLSVPSVTMHNILGQDKEELITWQDKAMQNNSDIAIHIYNKKDWKNNRKMGHVNVLGDDSAK